MVKDEYDDRSDDRKMIGLLNLMCAQCTRKLNMVVVTLCDNNFVQYGVS